MLGSINAAGRVLHRSLMQLDAGCGHRRGCQCVSATSDFFFFHADLATICVNSGRVTLNQADSAKIGSYQLAAETDRNRLKSALNHAETAEISFE